MLTALGGSCADAVRLTVTLLEVDAPLALGEQVDMLVVDHAHLAPTLARALPAYAHRVRRFIVVHGTAGERSGEGLALWAVVERFLASAPTWQLRARLQTGVGLTILNRRD